MKVLIASPLRSYTNARQVDGAGGTLGELMADLDGRFPGIRFRMIDEQSRIRRHVRIFINGDQTFDISRRLGPNDEVQIVQALSGG